MRRIPSLRTDRAADGRASLLQIAAAILAIAPGPVLAQTETAGKGRQGQDVYESVCASCHATGQLNAPKFGDAKAWKKLIAEGQRELTRAAIKGIRQMPAKGGDPSLTPLEVERAVVYMANAAGGKFREPR